MDLLKFITTFRKMASLHHTDEELVSLVFKKTIDLILAEEDPDNDKYISVLESCNSVKDLQLILNDHPEYESILIAGSLVVFDDLTQHSIWSPDQKKDIGKLLDALPS